MKKVLCLLFIVSFSIFGLLKSKSYSQDAVEEQVVQGEVQQKNKPKKEKKINPKKFVQSTQGIDINQNISKTLKRTKAQNKEVKQKQKRANDYIKHKKQQKSLNEKLKYKQRELEFLNHRLELKQQKLEEYTSSETEKGEKE